MDLRFSCAAILFLMVASFMLPGGASAHDMAYYTPPPMFEEAVAHTPAPAAVPVAVVGPSAAAIQAIIGAPYAAATVSAEPPAPRPPLPHARPSRFSVSPAYARMLREGKAPAPRKTEPEPPSYPLYKDAEILALKPMTVQDILESLE